jgi:hypothetical protein
MRYAPHAETVLTAGWEPMTPPTGADPGGGNQEATGCFQT